MKKVIFSILVLFAMFSCEQTPDFKVGDIEQIDSTDVKVIKTIVPRITDRTERYKDVCDKINMEIKVFTDTVTDSFSKEATEFYDDFVKDAENPSSARYELATNYDHFYGDNDIISYRFLLYMYTAGAHGLTSFYSYIYDLKTGERLYLKDLFKTDEVSLSKINKLLKKHFENPYDCFDEEPEIDKDFENVNIVRDSVLFTFGYYQLGAYACGPAEIKLPLEELKEEKLLMKR